MVLRFLAVASLTLSLHAAEIQVAAAADLADVEAPLAAAFQKKSGVSIRWITGSSGLLSKQAENGAPFDVFLSASESYVQELVAHESALADTVAVYATGRLGLWSASGSVRELNDLLKPSVLHLAIANPAHAPYGVAAKEALESSGLWKRIEPKIVYGENVRQALQFAESGNADAVVTAWALIRLKPGAVMVNAKFKPIRQAGVVLKSTHEPKAAREFLNFLMGADAQRILHDAGFGAAQ
jgi:molybdate transport system substrate-binding protein